MQCKMIVRLFKYWFVIKYFKINIVCDLGRDLWVLLISKNPHEEPILKPNVKYVANMHGNEVCGHRLS